MEKEAGEIENIWEGHGAIKIFGRTILKETPDSFAISNGKHLLKGYKQIGLFTILRPHNFQENDKVIVFKENGKITDIKKAEILELPDNIGKKEIQETPKEIIPENKIEVENNNTVISESKE